MHNGRKNKIRYDLIPVVLAAGIVPLIMRLHMYTNDALAGYSWFSQQDYNTVDAFLWAKSCALQILGAVILILLIDRVFIQRKKLSWERSLYLLLAYLGLVFVSGILSDNRALAFKGSYERFETVGVIAAYLIIFYYSYTTVRTEEDLSLVLKSMGVCLVPMILTGIMQSLGHDPMGMDIIKKLYVPGSLHESLANISLLREKGIAYLTLYNENYLGMYFGVLIPVFISLIFAVRRPVVRIMASILAVSSLFILYHGSSSTGWMALALTAFIVMWILSSKSRKGLKWASIVTGILFLAAMILMMISPGVRSRVDRTLHEGRGRVRKVTAIETLDDEVVFYYILGNELHTGFDIASDGSLRPWFKDRDGNDLLYSESDGIYVLDECFEYADAAVGAEEVDGIMTAVFQTDDHLWPMLRGEDGGYYYLNPAMKADKIRRVASTNAVNESFLSGRGAIWNRCVPLMSRHILTGSGANTFICEFPQDDYVDLNYRLGWGGYEYNVKAHSFYINDWIENGMIADLCLIIFFFIYLIRGARIYNGYGIGVFKAGFMPLAGLGLYAGCLTYMIAAIVNDSNVCTAPVFWTALGISVSVIELVQSHQNHKCSYM